MNIYIWGKTVSPILFLKVSSGRGVPPHLSHWKFLIRKPYIETPQCLNFEIILTKKHSTVKFKIQLMFFFLCKTVNDVFEEKTRYIVHYVPRKNSSCKSFCVITPLTSSRYDEV